MSTTMFKNIRGRVLRIILMGPLGTIVVLFAIIFDMIDNILLYLDRKLPKW